MPAPWRTLKPVRPAAGSAKVRDELPGGTLGNDKARRIPIGVLVPFSRPIARPAADSPFPADAVDRVAVERAVGRARRRARGHSQITLVESLYTFERYGWGTPQDSFSVLLRLHDVHGLIGYIGPNARIDTATALHTEVPLVNVAPTEPTPDEVRPSLDLPLRQQRPAPASADAGLRPRLARRIATCRGTHARPGVRDPSGSLGTPRDDARLRAGCTARWRSRGRRSLRADRGAAAIAGGRATDLVRRADLCRSVAATAVGGSERALRRRRSNRRPRVHHPGGAGAGPGDRAGSLSALRLGRGRAAGYR